MQRIFGGGRKTNDRDASNDPDTHDGIQADERTHLLPQRDDSGSAYLSPDDPAVSPYNLFTVRLVRYLTIFFSFVTFLWWVLLLVSLFVTPPGLQTRGSGFFGFMYTTMAFLDLIILLLFFSAPSMGTRVMAGIISVLLLVNMIVILAVQKTREEETWTGIASVVLILLMSVWTLVSDRVVQWGKEEEEERLTGRAESRRTLVEWVEVLLSNTGLLIVAIVSVLLTCTLVLRALDARVAAPGELLWVDGDKYQIHLYCHGNKTDAKGVALPTVLFEAGEDTFEKTMWQFANNAVANGSISRYCFADRPGYAWSDTAPSPFSAGQATAALSEALARSQERGPWVLAGAGIGSLYTRVFSSRHAREVKGLLLIDPLHEDLLDRVGAPGRGFLLWLRGVISPLGIDRIPGAIFRGRTSEDRIWGRSSYQTGKQIHAKLQESLTATSLTRRDVEAARAIQDPFTPLVIISSGVQVSKDSEWESKQRDLTHLTKKLQDWDIINKAPHQVWNTLEGREVIERRLQQLVHGK